MTDRPILFSDPMVRALIEGCKTQTRRILKISGHRAFTEFGPSDTEGYDWHFRDAQKRWHDLRDSELRERLGFAVGDRLWVREKWQGLSFGDYLPTKSQACDLRFAATDPLADADRDVRGYPWRPGIHMPRWASRLTLIVTDVRVQQLQEITLQDICAEGLARSIYDFKPVQQGFYAWESLWDGLNAERAPWASNPWVCAVTFTAHRANIDQIEATP